MPKQIIAYQGEPGAFSHIAALKYFGPKTQTLTCPNFLKTFEALVSHKATHAILPIENTIAGSIYENYDHLNSFDVHIVGELYLTIAHHLLANQPNIDLIDTVYSHTKAIEQCQTFLRSHPNIKSVAYLDTAGSARYVAQRHLPTEAAIASASAAHLYDLQVVQPHIESNPKNYTRFIIVTKTSTTDSKANKVSLLFTLTHEPGSLLRALKLIANQDHNLTKIESRPLIGKPWEYLFYLDFEFTTSPSSDFYALLQNQTTSLKILGAYPTGNYVTE